MFLRYNSIKGHFESLQHFSAHCTPNCHPLSTVFVSVVVASCTSNVLYSVPVLEPSDNQESMSGKRNSSESSFEEKNVKKDTLIWTKAPLYSFFNKSASRDIVHQGNFLAYVAMDFGPESASNPFRVITKVQREGTEGTFCISKQQSLIRQYLSSKHVFLYLRGL